MSLYKTIDVGQIAMTLFVEHVVQNKWIDFRFLCKQLSVVAINCIVQFRIKHEQEKKELHIEPLIHTKFVSNLKSHAMLCN